MLTRHGLPSLIVLAVAALSALGCDRDLGECNLDGTTQDGRPLEGPAALDIAFRLADGLPMYEGQALVQSSCGAGQFCHADGAVGGDRFGVAAGLNFDVNLACTDPSVDSTCANLQPCQGDTESPYCERLDRLQRNQGIMTDWAGDAISDIRRGSMPPGEAGRTVRDEREWQDADGETLPQIGTSEAEEIVRNWLACASPIIARTEFAPSAELELTPCASLEGETCIYSGPQGALPDPTWSSIYFSLIFESCLTCHGPLNGNMDQNPNNPLGGTIPGGASSEGLAALDLSGTDVTDTTNWATESHSAVFDVPASAESDCAGQGVIVVPNDATGSLMVQKLRAVQTCGDEMPPVGGSQTISNSVIEVVENWINMGAPNN